LLCKYPVDLLAFDKGSEEQHKEQRLNLCREFLEHALIPCSLQKPKKWGNDFRFQNKMTIFAYCLAIWPKLPMITAVGINGGRKLKRQ